jgi:hypothetical protein
MEVLKKKISTFRGDGGKVRITDDQLYLEILYAWEQWKGTGKEFFRTLGVSKTGLSAIIGKAKRMRREGHFPASEFKEIKVEESPSNLLSLTTGPCSGMEILWDNGKLIRFQQVEQLIDFLKKVA